MPGESAGPGLRSVFLAFDPVLRAFLAKDFADRALGGAIGFGHGVITAGRLVVGVVGSVRPEMGKRGRPGGVGKLQCQGQKRPGQF